MARKKSSRSRDKKRKTRISFDRRGRYTIKKESKKDRIIRKISSDGKINKKEMQKARKKGSSLRAIERRNIKNYRQSKRTNRRTPTERRGSRRPTYEPLLISRGAERVNRNRDRDRGRSRSPRRRGPQGRTRGPIRREQQQPTNQYQQEIQNILGGLGEQGGLGGQFEQTGTTSGGTDPNQGYLDAIADLQETIQGMNTDVPDYSAEFEAMREEQERLMAEMAAAQAEQERQRQLAFRTSQENAARGGMVADFRIGARSPRDQMGTSGFKRRPLRRPATTITRGIAPTTAGQTINI